MEISNRIIEKNIYNKTYLLSRDGKDIILDNQTAIEMYQSFKKEKTYSLKKQQKGESSPTKEIGSF